MAKKKENKMAIQNVVALAVFQQYFDLNYLSKVLPHAEYNPKVFPGLILRLHSLCSLYKSRTTLLIFNTGKTVCVGARSERQARSAIKKVAQELRAHGISIKKEPKVEIKNIVASTNIGGKIDLEAFYNMAKLNKKIIYEPEQFPDIIYRMDSPRVIFLIFSNGKLVCVGAKNVYEVNQALTKITCELENSGAIMMNRISYECEPRVAKEGA